MSDLELNPYAQYLQVHELNARIAELEKKNADVKFELDAALGWYEKWQKIASDRSKEILRLMDVESESKRKDEVLVWDADKILECTTRIVEQSERIAEMEAKNQRLRDEVAGLKRTIEQFGIALIEQLPVLGEKA